MPIDISAGIFRQVKDAEREAQQHLNRGEYAEAAKQFRRCHRLMLQYAEYGQGEMVQRMRLDEAEKYLAKATQYAERATAQSAPIAVTAVAERSGSDDYQSVIEGLITRVGVRWDDIGGLEETKREIQTNFALGLVKVPTGVKIRPNRTVLLYGPPGTGKTMLAGAISNELDATFFNARIPDLLSQYFGESSKLISALYATAATHAPSVVFLDELDALSRQRGAGSESGAERRVLNTLLSELDGLQHKGDEMPLVMTVGATNMPWELDRAILSRFSGGRIYVTLPDADARRQIIDIYVRRNGHTAAIGADELVRLTAGYSGREIERIIYMAVQSMLRRTNPDLLAHAANGRAALGSYQLGVEPLRRQDFESALQRVKPTSNPEELRRFENWSEE
jgi:katanin p60 ATPase-containing subunit A1